MVSKDSKEISLLDKLEKIRVSVKVLRKNQEGYNYTYVDEEQILAGVTAGMEKWNVTYYGPYMDTEKMKWEESVTEKTKYNKDLKQFYSDVTKEWLIAVPCYFEWVNLDNPTETFRMPWFIIGQGADASQAFGSALTYCGRYFLLKFFKIATTKDDPDVWRSKQKEFSDAELQMALSSLISEIAAIINTNVNDENRDGLLKLLRSLIKVNGKGVADYNQIKTVEVAQKVLGNLTKYFGLKEVKE